MTLTCFILLLASSQALAVGNRTNSRGYQSSYDQYSITSQDTGSAELEPDHFYSRYPPPQPRPRPGSRVNLTQIGIVALIKLLLLKIKFLAIGLVLLLKLPLVLMTGAFKFLLAVKAVKVLKLMMVPLVLTSILPLAAFFLPLLLPLLLLLPIPILTTTTTPMSTTVRTRRDIHLQDDELMALRKLLNSEQCLQKIACRFASRDTLPYRSLVPWVLEIMGNFIKSPRFPDYVGAYEKALKDETPTEKCSMMYYCGQDVSNLS